MKYIFVAYYFEPFEGVGGKRISYWAKKLMVTENDKKFVITRFNENFNTKDNDFNLYRFSYDVKSRFLWFLWAFKTLISLLVIDKSIVVITGGPFFPMALGFLVRLMGAKLILDFRDPYARNPLHKVSISKKIFKYFFEFIVCLPANKIITTSIHSGNLIASSKQKFVFIDNGYDESVKSSIDTSQKKIKNTIGYAGKISPGRDINKFLKILENHSFFSDYTFHYIGPDEKLINDNLKCEVISHGPKPYKETLEILNSLEILLLIYGGEKFESSTKIFDYIGLEGNIIVYNSREIYEGAAIDILEMYGSYKVFNENTDNIFYSKKKYIEFFSRSEGLKKFEKILDSV